MDLDFQDGRRVATKIDRARRHDPFRVIEVYAGRFVLIIDKQLPVLDPRLRGLEPLAANDHVAMHPSMFRFIRRRNRYARSCKVPFIDL